MPRRFYFRDVELELDGFVSGTSKSYALDQAINNQSPSAVKPITFFGGELAPRSLSNERGLMADASSLSVDPPDSGSHTDANENWRGFLTHFVTPPLAAQTLRAGFLKLGLKAIHASAASTVVFEFSVYVVDDAGTLVSFLSDIDRGASSAFAADATASGAIKRLGVPCRGADISEGGRLVIEVWIRQTVTDAAGTEGVGAEFFLNGADESLATDSVGAWAEFAQPIQLADDEPVFASRIDPLVGVRHHKIFATDVIAHEDASEQRVKL